jgi:hypothetical protein
MSLVNNIAAFTNIIGTEHPDIVFAFASADWQNDDERNKFISELLELNDNKKIGS